MSRHRPKYDFSEALRYIGHGRKQAVSLPVLARLMRKDERTVRDMLQMINSNGAVVVIREHGIGYYIPETAEEIDGYIRYHESYRRELSRKIAGMRKYRKENISGETD